MHGYSLQYYFSFSVGLKYSKVRKQVRDAVVAHHKLGFSRRCAVPPYTQDMQITFERQRKLIERGSFGMGRGRED